MASAKKCDRCGKYYDNNKSTLRGYPGTLCGVTFVRSVGQPRCIGEKDLCDECIAKLIRFMNGCELQEE